MEIEILNTHKNDFSPVIGERTMELLSRFGQKLDAEFNLQMQQNSD